MALGGRGQAPGTSRGRGLGVGRVEKEMRVL